MLADYLQGTDVVDSDHAAIKTEARRICGSSREDVACARRLFEFVRDHIAHTGDAGAGRVTCRASDVLAARTGMCYAKSHLLAALLRAVGIPAGFCYQRLRNDSPASGFVLHGLNGIYLASVGRWIRADARGNKTGVDAQFDGQSEKLAFAPDAAKGELTYPTIYVAPVECVVSALACNDRLETLLAELPGELPRQ